MTFVTHATTGAALAVVSNQPIWLGIAISLLPDLDHLFFVKTWKFKQGGFFDARSFMHELLGLFLLTSIGLFITLFKPELGSFVILCLTFNLFFDFINGKSIPYSRIRKRAAIVDLGKSLPPRVAQELILNLLCLGIFLNADSVQIWGL